MLKDCYIEISVFIITIFILILEALFIFALDKQINENSSAMKNLISRLEDNKDLEAFLFAASHDLKEPVRTIMNHVSFINEELPENLGNSIHSSVNRISEKVDYLYKLTDNLLDFHKAKHHKQENISVNLNKLITQVIKARTI